MSDVKYPNIVVDLIGKDGNAFGILGMVTGAMRMAGVEKSEVDAFRNEAIAGDYDHLLQTVMKWVSVGYGEDIEDDDESEEDYWDEDDDFVEDEW